MTVRILGQMKQARKVPRKSTKVMMQRSGTKRVKKLTKFVEKMRRRVRKEGTTRGPALCQRDRRTDIAAVGAASRRSRTAICGAGPGPGPATAAAAANQGNPNTVDEEVDLGTLSTDGGAVGLGTLKHDAGEVDLGIQITEGGEVDQEIRIAAVDFVAVLVSRKIGKDAAAIGLQAQAPVMVRLLENVSTHSLLMPIVSSCGMFRANTVFEVGFIFTSKAAMFLRTEDTLLISALE